MPSPREHSQIRLHPRILRALVEAGLPHVPGAVGVPGQIVSESERRLRFHERGSSAEYLFQGFTSLQNPPRLEEETGHSIAQVVELGAEHQGSLVLLDGTLERTGSGIAFRQVGMTIRQLPGHRSS